MLKRRKAPAARYLVFVGPRYYKVHPIVRTCSPAPFVKYASLPNGQGAAHREALDLSRPSARRERARALLRSVPA